MIESGIGGQIRGVSLDSFLQMAQMEKTTCTLTIISGKKAGLLYISKGELVSAEAGDLKNLEAAYEIVAWEQVTIEIENVCHRTENEIRQPLMNILMEGLRRKDELRAQGLLVESPAEEVETPAMEVEIPPEPEEDSAGGAPPSDSPARPVEQAASADYPAPAVPGPGATQKTGGKWVLVAMFLVLLAGGGYFGSRLFLGGDSAKDYDALLASLENESDLAKHLEALQGYVETHGSDADTARAEERIKELRGLLEEQDYDRLTAGIQALPMDDAYEAAARSRYEVFLAKYPDGMFSQEVKGRLEGLPGLLDERDYQKVQQASQAPFGEKIGVYNTYLKKHPAGKYRETVQQMMANLGDAYFAHLNKQVPACDRAQQWEPCIDLCNGFIGSFKEDPRLEAVVSLKIKMKGKQDLHKLMAEAAGADPAAARRLLQDYLQSHPDTLHRAYLEEKIAEFDGKVREQASWESVLAYAQDKSRDIERRFDDMQQYIDTHSQSAYLREAKTILAQLEAEKRTIQAQRKQDALESIAMAKVQAEQEKRRQEALRLKKMEQQIASQLTAVSRRYRSNGDGTVSDLSTGLQWTLLNSGIELGKCLNYREAMSYVAGLSTGGHRDWRLPTGAELAGIYKNEPYFPAGGVEWFWSSESYIKGYHKIANTVTAKQETFYNPEQQSHKACGTVHAVRP